MFTVEVRLSNGYRCACCMREWEDTYVCETLEDACEYLKMMTGGETERTWVSITEDATGKEIGHGELDFSSGISKYSGYEHSRWSGTHPMTGDFEILKDGENRVVEGKTWEEVLQDVREKTERKRAAAPPGRAF